MELEKKRLVQLYYTISKTGLVATIYTGGKDSYANIHVWNLVPK